MNLKTFFGPLSVIDGARMFMTWGGVQDLKFLAFIEEEEEKEEQKQEEEEEKEEQKQEE